MASTSYNYYLTLLIFAIIVPLKLSQATNPNFLLPIIKDSTKPQYYTTFQLGTPPFRLYLSIDLSNPWSWFTCLTQFNTTIYEPVPNSRTYRPLPCNAAACAAAYGSQFCYDCDYQTCAAAKGQTCGAEPYGPYYYTHQVQGHEVAPLIVDNITIYRSTESSSSLGFTQLAKFPFTCGYTDVLKGLSHYTKGILGLARKDSSLHGLISKTFNVPHKFAICLPSPSSSTSSSSINGAMYFGGGPYNFFPQIKSFVTTPLVLNPIDIGVTFYKGNFSTEYFINVKNILIDGVALKLNSSLLTIDKNTGFGGTKLSTIDGYTTLHSEIYNALVSAFATKAAAMNITRAARVSEFGACFNSVNIVGSKTGPKVPIIDLELDGKSSIWRIYGANSMIKVSNDVRCLGFIDGGVGVKTSIVIGGKQMEDNLIEFDLESSELGFTSSLLSYGTSCSQFKGV